MKLSKRTIRRTFKEICVSMPFAPIYFLCFGKNHFWSLWVWRLNSSIKNLFFLHFSPCIWERRERPAWVQWVERKLINVHFSTIKHIVLSVNGFHSTRRFLFRSFSFYHDEKCRSILMNVFCLGWFFISKPTKC